MNNHKHKVRNPNSYEKSVTFEDIKKLMKILNQKLNVAIKEEVTFSTGDHTNAMVEETMDTPLHGQYKNVKKSKMSADAPEFIPRSQQLIQLKSIFNHFPFENNDNEETLMIPSNTIGTDGAVQLNETGKNSNKINITFPPSQDEEEEKNVEKDSSQMTSCVKSETEEDGNIDEVSEVEEVTSSNEELPKVVSDISQTKLKHINRNFSAIDKGTYNENEENASYECVKNMLAEAKRYTEAEINQDHIENSEESINNIEKSVLYLSPLNGECKEESICSNNITNSADDSVIEELSIDDHSSLHDEIPASEIQTEIMEVNTLINEEQSEPKDKTEPEEEDDDDEEEEEEDGEEEKEKEEDDDSENNESSQGGDISTRLRAEMLALLNKEKGPNDDEEDTDENTIVKVEEINSSNSSIAVEHKTAPQVNRSILDVNEQSPKEKCQDQDFYSNDNEKIISREKEDDLETTSEEKDEENSPSNCTEDKIFVENQEDKHLNDVNNETSSNTDSLSTIDEVNGGTDNTEHSSVELSTEVFTKSHIPEPYNMESPVLICHNNATPKYVPAQGGNMSACHVTGKENSNNTFETLESNQRMFRTEEYATEKKDQLNEYLSKMKELKTSQEEFKKKWNSNLSKREQAYYTYLKCTEKANIYRAWAENVPTILPTKLWNTKKQNSLKWQSISDDISLLCLKSEVVLSKMKAEKHKDKYEEIDRKMISCIQQEKYNKSEQNELENAWKKATSTEEQLAREMWSYRRKWLENYAKFYQKPEIIDKISNMAGKRLR